MKTQFVKIKKKMCIEMCAKREYEGRIEGVLLNESCRQLFFFSHKLNYSQLKIIRLKISQFIVEPTQRLAFHRSNKVEFWTIVFL